MRCLPLILFHVFTWLSTSVPHQLYTMSRTLYSCIRPQTSIWSSLVLHLWIHHSERLYDLLPTITLWCTCAKGECHTAQHQTEGILGLTDRGEMDKTGQGGREAGNSYYSLGDWASPNQHVDNIWKFDTKYSDIQPSGAVLNSTRAKMAKLHFCDV